MHDKDRLRKYKQKLFSKYLKVEKWFGKIYLSSLKNILEKDDEGENICFSYCHSQIFMKLLEKLERVKLRPILFFSYQLQYLFVPCYSEIILFQPHHLWVFSMEDVRTWPYLNLQIITILLFSWSFSNSSLSPNYLVNP